MILTDLEGNQTYRMLTAAENMNVTEKPLGKCLDYGSVNDLLQTADQLLTVKVRVSTGELLTAFDGNLTLEK